MFNFIHLDFSRDALVEKHWIRDMKKCVEKHLYKMTFFLKIYYTEQLQIT